jgi:hypothetical protein
VRTRPGMLQVSSSSKSWSESYGSSSPIQNSGSSSSGGMTGGGSGGGGSEWVRPKSRQLASLGQLGVYNRATQQQRQQGNSMRAMPNASPSPANARARTRIGLTEDNSSSRGGGGSVTFGTVNKSSSSSSSSHTSAFNEPEGDAPPAVAVGFVGIHPEASVSTLGSFGS